jgi:hypothetical protein
MDDNPFRWRPFFDTGIDFWKLALVVVIFFIFLGGLAYSL